MKGLNNKMKEIAFFLEKFVHKSNGCYVDINFSNENDIGKICKIFTICISYTNTIFCRKNKYPFYSYDYTIDLICKKSEENDIIFDNSQILWTKKATITFMIKDIDEMKKVVSGELNDIFNKYVVNTEPAKITMCVPPEINDPNYREHMNEYIKNKLEGKI